MQEKRQTAFDRRNFLLIFGGAAVVAGATATLIADEAEAYDPGEKEAGSRYRETSHVKAFYRVNGYETLRK